MIDPLLALCARVEAHPVQCQKLLAAAETYAGWATLPERAETNGLAPLVHIHLRQAGIPVPDEPRRTLLALTLRHRRANQIRNAALAEILPALAGERIEAIVLKGAALANSLYPRPALRPMRDIDLLVAPRDALRAQQKLVDLGYDAPMLNSADPPLKHHLPVAMRVEDGLTISVEVHHRLLPYAHHALDYAGLRASTVPFELNHVPARTLGHEDMLWHIYSHSFALPLIEQPVRLVWLADFVSLVEKHVNQIDWARIQRVYPQVWNVLPIFHFLAPWSDEVIQTLRLDIDRPPKGVGQTFQGWPHSSLANQRQKGVRRFLVDTFWPPEWWTQLYYGLKRPSLAWWWTRLVRHPLHIAGWVLQYLGRRDK